MYKPDAYNSLSPYLIVENAQQTLDFIKAVFGAEPLRVQHGEGGSVAHAEIRIDDTVLMLGEWPGNASAAHVHVYVPDVDTTFEKARTAGGVVVQEPAQKDDADRRGGITDPAGTTWWLATTQGFANAG